MKKEKGISCSKNFVFDKQIENIEDFEYRCKHGMISVFWLHRVYPVAFVIHQSYITLKTNIRRGNMWSITKKIKDL